MDRFDLCLSFRRGDPERARALLRALEADEARVYTDDGETTALPSIQRAVHDHLGRCRMLLLFVDGAEPVSRAGQFFFAQAYIAARKEGDPARRIVLVGEPPTGRLYAGLPVVPAPAAEDEAGLRSLAVALRARFEAVRGGFEDITPVVAPEWLPTAPPLLDRFVGRTEAMHALHASLEQTRVTTLLSQPAGYDGAGQRGLGRTLLAEEYALRFGSAWPGGVFWLRAHGHAPISEELRERLRRDQLRAIARRMDLPVDGATIREVEQAITRSIAARNLPALWVVDDLPAAADSATRDAWLLPDPLVHALVLTRALREGDVPSVVLGPLLPGESHALLTRTWRPRGGEEEAVAKDLVGRLMGHPLALDAAGGGMGVGAPGRGPGLCRAAVRSRTDEVRARAFSLFEYVPEGVSMPLAGLLGRVLEQIGPEGQDVLRLAGILALAPVQRSLLSAALVVADGVSQEAADQRADIGLSQVDRAAMSSRGATEGGPDAERWVHPVWVALLTLQDPEPWRGALLREGLVAALARRLGGDAPPPVSLLAAARTCGADGDGPGEASLLHGLASALLALGDPEDAERAYAQAAAARERLVGASDPETLVSREGQATARWAKGDHDGAVALAEDVLAARRDRGGDGDPGTLSTLDLLSRWYFEVGRKPESRALIERLHDARRRTLGGFHPATLECAARLARVLVADGESAAALRLVDEALTRIGRQPERGHLPALDGLVAVGAALRAAGEPAPARRILETVCTLLKRLVGLDDARTISAMTMFAKVLVDLDDLGAARRVETDTLAALIRAHGDTHPDTLTMMNNLGTTLSGLGELQTARHHLERAWKQRTVVLGAHHTDTVVTGWNLHSVLLRLGQDSGAVLAELEWLLEARPEGLSPKQRKVREALLEIVAAQTPGARDDRAPRGGWQKALSWVSNPFRRR